MKRLGLTILKNATANVVRGGATAAVAIALPHFLVHSLDVERFSAWSLILQIAAYASFLDFGLQTAVARFIAQAVELDQKERIRQLIGTAFMMLGAAALITMLLMGGVILFANSLFHGVPPVLLREFQTATMVMAVSAAVLLPLSAYTGVLVGLHQNEFPALAVGGSRLVGAAAAIVVSRYTHSLVAIAFCVAIPNLIGGLVQVAIVKSRLAFERAFHLTFDKTLAKNFLSYCAGLTVWSFGMLIVSGLDVTIVGHFQFAAVGYYAICSTAINIFATGNGTIMNAFLAPFSAMHAKRDFQKTRDIVIKSTRINTTINFVALGLVIAFGERVLKLWVGASYAHNAYPILIVLMLTQAVRLMGSSFSIALMAAGHQNSNFVPAGVEAFSNLGLSLWGAQRFGPIGVAYGSLVGAVLGIPALLVFAVKVREDLQVKRGDLLVRGMLTGIAPALPLLACSIYFQSHVSSLQGRMLCWTFMTLLGAGLFVLINRTNSAWARPRRMFRI